MQHLEVPRPALVIRPFWLLLPLGVALGAAAAAVALGGDYWRELPAINAGLNTAATILLIAGYRLIRRGREAAHVQVMLWAFAVSMVFLAAYLTYHYQLRLNTGQSGRPFSGPAALRPFYWALLISHVLLAAAVPFLAGITIWLGLRDRRAAHRRWAWIAFPIWLYVSVTGVAIYAILYLIFPPD